MKKNKSITIKELALSLQVSDMTIKNNILKLKKQGCVKRIGADKGGYWKAVK